MAKQHSGMPYSPQFTVRKAERERERGKERQTESLSEIEIPL